MMECLSQLAQAASDAASGGWGSSPILAILFLIIGLAFVVAEIFVVTFGVFTICALSFLIGGVIVAFNAGPAWGIGLLIAAILGVPILIVTAVKVMPRTRFGRRLIPESPKLEDVSSTGVDRNLTSLLGKEGRTLSMCRPAGTAEFEGNRCDVVSEGLTILAEKRVKVVAVEGNRVVVREMN